MKSQDLLTTEHYVKKWPYIVIYQHQNMTVPMWQELRSKLGTERECMVVKNTSINRIFKDEALSGGSMCLIGVSSMEDFKDLSNITNDYNYILLIIGGYWNKQCWSHDDVKYICNLGSINNIFNDLINTMNQSLRLTSILDQTNELFISTLNSNNTKICYTLSLHSKRNTVLFCIYIK